MKKRGFSLILMCLILIIGVYFPSSADTLSYKYSDVEVFYVSNCNILPIPAYEIGGDLAICVEDLRSYGYDMKWNPSKRTTSFTRKNLELNRFDYGNPEDFPFKGLSTRPIKNNGKILKSDVKIYIDGKLIPSYNTNGFSLVKIRDVNSLTKEMRLIKYKPLNPNVVENLYPVGFAIPEKFGFVNKDLDLVIKADYSPRSVHNEFTGGDIMCYLPDVISSSEIDNYIEFVDGEGHLRLPNPINESHNLSLDIIDRFNFVSQFENGIAVAQVGGSDPVAFCPAGGSSLVHHKYIKNRPNSDGLYGYIDVNGNPIIMFRFKHATPFSDDLAIVCNSEDKYGVINKAGDIVVPFGRYGFINSYHNGYALVENFVESSDSYEYFFIDKAGNKVFDKVFTNAKSFDNGLASVSTSLGCGLIDTSGNYVKGPISNAVDFYKDLSFIRFDTEFKYDDGTSYTESDFAYMNDLGFYIFSKQPTFGATMNNSIYLWH